MRLTGISVGYISSALGLKSARGAIEAYSVGGGTQRYWELAAPYGDDVKAAVSALVLHPMGVLHDEPHRLLLEEIPSAISLRPILDAIGQHAHRVSEIAARLSLPATSLSKSLLRLQELDLVEREIPFGAAEKGGKSALYRIGDRFVHAWFEMVASRRSLLAQAPDGVRQQLLKQMLPAIYSNTWERLCRQAVPHLQKQLGGVFFGPSKRFWHKQGPEWDVVSQSIGSKILLLGEVKWLERDADSHAIADILQELKSKGVPPVNRSENVRVVYAVFVPALKEKPMQLPENVYVITAEDVIAALSLGRP